MIPILFDKKAKKFNTNGIGRLSDTISCIVTEERNGSFELEMRYPVTGEFFSRITTSSIIYAVPSDGGSRQPFRVYKISKPLNGEVTINAEHISYQLTHIPVSPFTAVNAADSFNKLKENAAEECPFTFWTDNTTIANFSVAEPASIRSRLGGTDGSILDVYGGEYAFDGYAVRLYTQRGKDNGVLIRYGKNMTDIQQEESISNTITGIYPYWKDSEGNIVQLPEKVISAECAENYPYPRTIPIDFSEDFGEQPTVEQLRERADNYIKSNKIGIPAVSITVSFIQLWQTEEYKDIAPLERVRLCDIVSVEFEQLGVSAKAKVIKTSYNVILERYESIELGEAKSNLATTIIQQTLQMQEKVTSSVLQDAITSATAQITGAKGGYIVFRYDANNQPYEILIMDTPDIETAVNVWRWNQGGFGHSSKGYNGEYTTAITQDGKIVANFILAGKLYGINIEGVNIYGSNISGGEINIADNFVVDSNGITQLKEAIITGGSLQLTADSVLSPKIEVISKDKKSFTQIYSNHMMAARTISNQIYASSVSGDYIIVGLFDPGDPEAGEGSTLTAKISLGVNSGIWSEKEISSDTGFKVGVSSGVDGTITVEGRQITVKGGIITKIS